MLKKSALCLALASFTICSQAQTTDIMAKTPYSAYVQDGRGVIARNATGLCWRTGYWTPADAVPGCDAPLAPACKAPQVLINNVCSDPPKEPVTCASNQMLKDGVCVAIPATATAPAAPKRCDFSSTFINDETFAFNKAVLSKAASTKIDSEILPKLNGCDKVDLLIITGHADKIGTQQYNQKLSEKRAEAVAAYLKGKGITANIETMGVGKTQSIKACDDKLPRKQLIECLTPNRRVVVEVRGTAK